jgi:UDP-N-acetylmuramoyl-L-alanyl-D-glutamate--2,6-diaminopimelate ligase
LFLQDEEMKLTDLCRNLPISFADRGGVGIDFVTLDSRKVRPGALFSAVVNPLRNNELYINDAVSRGASAILASKPAPVGPAALLIAENLPELTGILAHRLWNDPTKEMNLVGVTGTNGKTTFTYLMESILREAGESVGVVGTIDYRFAGQNIPAANTTPESPDLAELFSRMRHAGVTTALMEASSHGLALSRVSGCRFRAGVFTNLTRDHMDFHAGVEEYLQAKIRLFSDFIDPNHPKGAFAVVNADDEAARKIIDSSRVRAVRYGRTAGVEYRIENVVSDDAGVRMRIESPQGALDVVSPLLGGFQVYNIAACVACALEMGIPWEKVNAGIAMFRQTPGRMERVPADDILAIVDYAHTPDALENLVAAGRNLAPGRLITLFGCGGDRDKGKRPLMAKAAAGPSDIVVVTSDNPRTESPASIIEDILRGLNLGAMDQLDAGDFHDYEGHRGLLIEEDRRQAIAMAVENAKAGDVLLIAGKGHEDYQIIGREKHHMDDREEAAAAIARRRDSKLSKNRTAL